MTAARGGAYASFFAKPLQDLGGGTICIHIFISHICIHIRIFMSRIHIRIRIFMNHICIQIRFFMMIINFIFGGTNISIFGGTSISMINVNTQRMCIFIFGDLFFDFYCSEQSHHL